MNAYFHKQILKLIKDPTNYKLVRETIGEILQDVGIACQNTPLCWPQSTGNTSNKNRWTNNLHWITKTFFLFAWKDTIKKEKKARPQGWGKYVKFVNLTRSYYSFYNFRTTESLKTQFKNGQRAWIDNFKCSTDCSMSSSQWWGHQYTICGASSYRYIIQVERDHQRWADKKWHVLISQRPSWLWGRRPT